MRTPAASSITVDGQPATIVYFAHGRKASIFWTPAGAPAESAPRHAVAVNLRGPVTAFTSYGQQVYPTPQPARSASPSPLPISDRNVVPLAFG